MTIAGDQRTESQTIGNLQILRLVAAAMVLFGHLNHEVLKKPALASGFVPFQPIWWHCGVDIFFVVSGFIMALITRDSFGQPGAGGQFLRARVMRLVPMYWLFTTLDAAGDAAGARRDAPPHHRLAAGAGLLPASCRWC